MQNINIFLLIFMDFMNKKHTPYNYINNIMIYDYYYKILWYKKNFLEVLLVTNNSAY